MPNWCENIVSFSGAAKDLEKLKKLIGTDEQPILFQKIKPMPQALDMDSGSSILGYEVVYGDVEKVLGYPWVKAAGITTREELIRHLEKERPEYLEAAEQYKSNIDRYGFRDWYDWRIANWGTKWDVEANDIQVVDDNPGYLSLAFFTAWSPPEGIYDALLELIDENKLDVQATWFYDEPGMQFAGYLS